MECGDTADKKKDSKALAITDNSNPEGKEKEEKPDPKQENLPSLQDLADLKADGLLPTKCFDKLDLMGMINVDMSKRNIFTKKILMKDLKSRPKMEQLTIDDFFVKG